jgi:hypothetical protein
MPARVDLVALHPEEYAAGRQPRLVPVTPARFLTLDGAGVGPGEGIETPAASLLRLLRTLRDRARARDGRDFRVPPLELLVGDRLGASSAPPDGPSPFKLLLRVPAFVRTADLAAIAPDGEPAWGDARIEELREGRCLQALHVGPLSDVAATATRLRLAAADASLAPRGRLHCALLSDPARTPPERSRILVRLPVKLR